MKKLLIFSLLTTLALAGCGEDGQPPSDTATPATTGSADPNPGATPDPGSEKIPQVSPADTDWPNFSGEGSQGQYSVLDQINLNNIDRLGVAWYFDLEPGFTVSSPVKG